MKIKHIVKYTTMVLIVILSSLVIFFGYKSYKKITAKNVVKKEVDGIKDYPYKLSNVSSSLYKKKYDIRIKQVIQIYISFMKKNQK